MTANAKSLELETKPVGKLLIQYAMPAIVAMTASSLYNMVDSIFIGRGVGAMAISGLALTFPLMNLMGAFGSMVGVGASTLMSVKLGQKDYKTATKILGNVVVLNIIIGIALTIIVIPFLDDILRFFGGSDQTIPYAHEYMFVILLGNFVTHLYLGLNALLRSIGRPRQAMNATIFTVVINTILDPIFIYGFGWGIAGAAIATILAQVLSLMYQFYIFSQPTEIVRLHKGIYKLQFSLVRDSLVMGLSPFLMNFAACFVVILINQGLSFYGNQDLGGNGGDILIGAYGIANRLVFFIVMVIIGVNQGMQPIAGYNYGAKLHDRVIGVTKYAIMAATTISTTGFLIAQLFAESIVGIFTTDAELIRLSAQGLRLMVLIFPLVGFQMVTGNFFQSIGKPARAIILSLARQVLVLIPCLIIMPKFFGYMGVWYSMPTSDLIATVLSTIFIIQHIKKLKREADCPRE